MWVARGPPIIEIKKGPNKASSGQQRAAHLNQIKGRDFPPQMRTQRRSRGEFGIDAENNEEGGENKQWGVLLSSNPLGNFTFFPSSP